VAICGFSGRFIVIARALGEGAVSVREPLNIQKALLPPVDGPSNWPRYSNFETQMIFDRRRERLFFIMAQFNSRSSTGVDAELKRIVRAIKRDHDSWRVDCLRKATNKAVECPNFSGVRLINPTLN
jgi:hypothetical protein